MQFWIAGSALFSILYLVLGVGRAQPVKLAPAMKTVPVALLALAGAVLGAPAAVWIGLAFGALGDFLLAASGRGSFLAGMASFAAGHLSYAWAFGLHWPGYGVIAALFALALSTEVWLAPHTGDLRWPVRGYVLMICLMAAAAFARSDVVLRIGAGFFLLSDVLLAVRLFRARSSLVGKVLPFAVWAVYWIGQTLILIAFVPGA